MDTCLPPTPSGCEDRQPTVYLTVPRQHFKSFPKAIPAMVVPTSWWDGRRLALPPTQDRGAGRRVVCDSGGFLAQARYGGFPYSVDELADWALSWGAEWVATPDVPCLRASSQAEVDRRVHQTVELALEAIQTRPDATWYPVLQGLTHNDYTQCWELYQKAGITPKAVGSLLRPPRQVRTILGTLAQVHPGCTYHLFGIRLPCLDYPEVRATIASLDTASWCYIDEEQRQGIPEYRISSSVARKLGYPNRQAFERVLATTYYQKATRLLARDRQQLLW